MRLFELLGFMRKKSAFVKSALGLTLFLIFYSAFGQAETVQLISGNDYSPYADSKLPNGGLSTEIVEKALAEVKIKVKIDWLPWARGLEETRQGKATGTFPYLKNPERERDFIYSDVVNEIKDRAFVKKGNEKKFDFSDVSKLEGKTICLPLGWTTFPKLDELIKTEKIKKTSPNDITTCIKMLMADRVDFFVSGEIQGIETIKASGFNTVVLADAPVLTDNSLYFIAPKALATSKDFIAKFNIGLAAIRKNGVYDKIMKAHLVSKSNFSIHHGQICGTIY